LAAVRVTAMGQFLVPESSLLRSGTATRAMARTGAFAAMGVNPWSRG
jgi:hypothetical protein